MPAHAVGKKSAHRIEEERQRAAEREARSKAEREAYVERLAQHLAECACLPLTVARKRVEQIAVIANPPAHGTFGQVITTWTRFG